MAKYSYKRGKATFVNPYNFVRIDRTKKHKTVDSTNTEKKLSGVLHCSFETKTPLAIPDIELGKIDNVGHASYPFYRINEVPSVPGSSIRGMLRSVYETLTDSCFVTLPEDTSVTARVIPGGENAFNPGVLIYKGEIPNGCWKLYSAKRHNLPIDKGSEFLIKIDGDGRYIEYDKNKYRTGEPVKIKVHKEEKEAKGKLIKKSIVDKISKTDSSNTYLYVGEDIKGKKYESVFEIKDEVKISKEEIERLLNGLKNSIKIYQNPSINKMFKQKIHTGYKNFEQAVKNGAACIWYKEDNGKYYFSMAAIGRKAYNKTVNDMIGEHRNPCIVIQPDKNKKDDNNKEEDKYKNLCPACKLFGMANGGGYGSKIRVTDAVVEGGYKTLGLKMLKELGSPRIGYYPFYTNNGKEYDQTGVIIAGRKYYWHIPRAAEDSSVYETSEKTERNATMELMSVGTKFNFDVYYDDVSKEQIDEVKWVLTLPDKSESLMHKLGHGKPLGLGSVKITINSDYRRKYDGKNYTVIEESIDVDSMPPRIQEDAWKQIAILCNYNAMKDCDVRYPYIDVDQIKEKIDSKKNDFAAHQWFTSNKGRRKYDTKPMTLAKVTEKEALNLKVYVPYLDDNSKNKWQRSGGKGKSYRNSKRGY